MRYMKLTGLTVIFLLSSVTKNLAASSSSICNQYNPRQRYAINNKAVTGFYVPLNYLLHGNTVNKYMLLKKKYIIYSIVKMHEFYFDFFLSNQPKLQSSCTKVHLSGLTSDEECTCFSANLSPENCGTNSMCLPWLDRIFIPTKFIFFPVQSIFRY